MRRLSVAVSVAALMLLGGAAASSPVGNAEAPLPASASTEGHPLVGAWLLVEPDDPDSPPSLVAFSADGIYHQSDFDGTSGIGSWEATGPSSANMTFVQQFADDDGEFAGSTTIRATIEVSPDGQSFSAQYTLELSLEGMPPGEYGPGTATATRIAVEPMGTPAGTLDDLFGQFQSEGTEPAAPATTTG